MRGVQSLEESSLFGKLLVGCGEPPAGLRLVGVFIGENGAPMVPEKVRHLSSVCGDVVEIVFHGREVVAHARGFESRELAMLLVVFARMVVLVLIAGVWGVWVEGCTVVCFF